MEKKWAIVGAGNGGHAFAAWLSMQGVNVSIYDFDQKTVDRLNELGGVTVEGNGHIGDKPFEGFAKIDFASTDIEKVIEGREVIFMILPSIYHKATAEKMAPYLADGQTVILNPIAPLGPIEFEKAIRDKGCKADITIAAACTLLFATRLVEVGHSFINGQKIDVAIAAYPASKNAKVEALTKPYFPQFRYVQDILQVGFDNLNCEYHPGPTLLYTAMIEKGLDFEYYIDYVPSQIKLVEAIDRERMELCRIYGYEGAHDTEQCFRDMYGYEGDLYTMITNADCYKGIKGPKSFKGLRYLEEDVPFALRAIQTLAKIAKVETPAIDAVVGLAYVLHGDHLKEGRTMEALGFTPETTVADVMKMCRG